MCSIAKLLSLLAHKKFESKLEFGPMARHLGPMDI